jgi:hypothetical protein
MNRYLITAICSLLIFSSCHFWEGKHIAGNGNTKQEDRTNGRQFSSVDVSNAFEVHIKQDSSYSIKIETDENLLQYIIVEKNGDELSISAEGNYNLKPANGHKVKIYLSSPVFKHLKASGACSLIGDNELSSNGQLDIDLSGASDASLDIKMPKITAGLSGASEVTLKGETKDFSIEGSGASHAKCFELLSENVEVDVSGASSADVFASVKINPSASGASNVQYKGKAEIGSKNEGGASSITKIN